MGEHSTLTMAKDTQVGWSDCLTNMKNGIEDFKVQLSRDFEVVYNGVQENREATNEICYILNLLSCQFSRIDDLDWDLKELMSIVDIIKDEVLKLAKLSQCSHCHELLNDEI